MIEAIRMKGEVDRYGMTCAGSELVRSIQQGAPVRDCRSGISDSWNVGGVGRGSAVVRQVCRRWCRY